MAKKPSLMDAMAEELQSPARTPASGTEAEASPRRERGEQWRIYETADGEPMFRHTFYLTEEVKDALDDELRRRKATDKGASGTQIVREALRAYLIERDK